METRPAFMPRELTSENGAKALLIGEFYEAVEVDCSNCFGGDDGDGEGGVCECCDGSGQTVMNVPVSWTTIKEIYAKAVQHLGT